ncbi:MAG: hypothetical protein AAGI10_03435 [Pseudomonadota bacterium]
MKVLVLVIAMIAGAAVQHDICLADDVVWEASEGEALLHELS